MKTTFTFAVLAALLLGALSGWSMISVGHLSKAQAAELGITMKQRPNGDAGTMVWLEFKKDGFLESFTYAEFRLQDPKGKHLVSARLAPTPVSANQGKEMVSVAFSADPAQLENCSFLIVAYGSSRGDVGYVLSVKDFLDLQTTAR